MMKNRFATATLSVPIALSLTLALLLPIPAPVHAAPGYVPQPQRNDNATALLAAVDVRARTQRFSRIFWEISANLRPNKARDLLAEEVTQIDRSLKQLNASAKTDDVRKLTNRINTRWEESKAYIHKIPTLENAEQVHLISEELFNYTQRLSMISEDIIGSEAGMAVDVSSRLMATSERLAKATLRKRITGVGSADVDLRAWQAEYETGLAQLSILPMNDSYAKGNLDLGGTMWKLYVSYLNNAMRTSEDRNRIDVVKSAEGMWNLVASTKQLYLTKYRNQYNIPLSAVS